MSNLKLFFILIVHVSIASAEVSDQIKRAFPRCNVSGVDIMPWLNNQAIQEINIGGQLLGTVIYRTGTYRLLKVMGMNSERDYQNAKLQYDIITKAKLSPNLIFTNLLRCNIWEDKNKKLFFGVLIPNYDTNLTKVIYDMESQRSGVIHKLDVFLEIAKAVDKLHSEGFTFKMLTAGGIGYLSGSPFSYIPILNFLNDLEKVPDNKKNIYNDYVGLGHILYLIMNPKMLVDSLENPNKPVDYLLSCFPLDKRDPRLSNEYCEKKEDVTSSLMKASENSPFKLSDIIRIFEKDIVYYNNLYAPKNAYLTKQMNFVKQVRDHHKNDADGEKFKSMNMEYISLKHEKEMNYELYSEYVDEKIRLLERFFGKGNSILERVKQDKKAMRDKIKLNQKIEDHNAYKKIMRNVPVQSNENDRTQKRLPSEFPERKRRRPVNKPPVKNTDLPEGNDRRRPENLKQGNPGIRRRPQKNIEPQDVDYERRRQKNIEPQDVGYERRPVKGFRGPGKQEVKIIDLGNPRRKPNKRRNRPVNVNGIEKNAIRRGPKRRKKKTNKGGHEKVIL